jgi:hypothetical protein
MGENKALVMDDHLLMLTGCGMEVAEALETGRDGAGGGAVETCGQHIGRRFTRWHAANAHRQSLSQARSGMGTSGAPRTGSAIKLTAGAITGPYVAVPATLANRSQERLT